MAKKAYIGVDGTARRINKMYLGVDDTARKVKKGYIGVGGVARPFFSAEKKLEYYGTLESLSEYSYELSGASVGDYALFAGGLTRGDYPARVYAYNSSLVQSFAPDITFLYSSYSSYSNTKYRGGLASASVGDYALFAGGGVYSAYPCFQDVNAYNSSLVRSIPDKAVACKYLAGASVGNYALFAGGYGSTKTLEAYDSSLVKIITSSLSQNHYCLASASTPDFAVFAGGKSNTNTYSKVVEAFDSSLVRTNPTELTNARDAFAGASIGNYVIFAGGRNIVTVEAYVVN